MAISTTLPIKLSDVCLEIYGSTNTSGKSLSGLFTDAIGTFNATYEGNHDRLTNFRGYTDADTIPPSQVTGLTATGDITVDIELSWDAASDNIGVTGYVINSSLDGSMWNIEGSSLITSYVFTAPNTNTLYYFRVQAYDAANNYGAWSTSASAYSGTII